MGSANMKATEATQNAMRLDEDNLSSVAIHYESFVTTLTIVAIVLALLWCGCKAAKGTNVFKNCFGNKDNSFNESVNSFNDSIEAAMKEIQAAKGQPQTGSQGQAQNGSRGNGFTPKN